MPATTRPGAALIRPPSLCLRARSQGRAADRPSRRLHDILQVDGYAGYRAFAERGDVQLVFCWAHVRRRFYELAAAEPAPIASEALERIAGLYTIEGEIRGRITDVTIRIVNGHSNSQIDDLLPWACPAAQDSNTWPENSAYALPPVP
jgi:hypothetical protein